MRKVKLLVTGRHAVLLVQETLALMLLLLLHDGSLVLQQLLLEENCGRGQARWVSSGGSRRHRGWWWGLQAVSVDWSGWSGWGERARSWWVRSGAKLQLRVRHRVEAGHLGGTSGHLGLIVVALEGVGVNQWWWRRRVCWRGSVG
ncbi:hypothetical protein ABW19_dt0203647 [Dactylella cylindrospora]|nr:hypothetical protein ABW19_dt0203647 [Dactylella cylindrospora]